jgi:purine-nucleoside phosphorylase
MYRMDSTANSIRQSADVVRSNLPQGWIPDVGIILGSGLGALADEVEAVASLPYTQIPGFGQSSVEGHAGRLALGTLEGTRVAIMQGRLHYYEGLDLQQVTFPVRVMRELGAHTLIVTNAAGGLNPDFRAGDLMLIEDHINLLGWGGHNPLRGPNDKSLGPRFPAMNPAYDPDLLQLAEDAAAECNVGVRRGVYIVVAGPNYETRAELRLLRQWGADAVGMSYGTGSAGGATWGYEGDRNIEHHQHGPRRQRRACQPRRGAGGGRGVSPALCTVDESVGR